MSMTDPIADMLTRIRNGQSARHHEVDIPYSGVKEQIARVLRDEGYVDAYRIVEQGVRRWIRVALRYTESGTPVMSGLERVSRPGRRLYSGSAEIPRVLGGMGICILSTSRGVMSDREARSQQVGGELLCNVW